MKWYKIYLNGENRIWKKCITYSWEFIYEDHYCPVKAGKSVFEIVET